MHLEMNFHDVWSAIIFSFSKLSHTLFLLPPGQLLQLEVPSASSSEPGYSAHAFDPVSEKFVPVYKFRYHALVDAGIVPVPVREGRKRLPESLSSIPQKLYWMPKIDGHSVIQNRKRFRLLTAGSVRI